MPSRLIVSTTSKYPTLKSAIDYLGTLSGTGLKPFEILIDAGTHNITGTITINYAYPLTIRGL